MVAQLDRTFIGLSKRKTITRLISYLLYEGRPLTTRGRWINPLLRMVFSLQVSRRPSRQVRSPVYIVGMGRSGTTVLGTTLAMHHDVGFLNEPKAMWSFVYPEEDLIGSYRLAPGRYVLDERNVSDRVREKTIRLFGAYLKYTNSARLLDKYPEMIFRTEFIQSIFPDARFIFLHRNGWDACRSIDSWSERKGVTLDGQRHDWWGLEDRKWRLLCEQIVAEDAVLGKHAGEIGAYVDQRHRAAVEWIVTMKRGLSLSGQDAVLRLRYEDYVSSPSEREQVLAFCGLGPDDNYRHYCSAVLEKQDTAPAFSLPEEIEGEFLRIMGFLGYA